MHYFQQKFIFIVNMHLIMKTISTSEYYLSKWTNNTQAHPDLSRDCAHPPRDAVHRGILTELLATLANR